MGSGLTRREVLRAGAAAGALVGLERMSHMKVIERALAAAPPASACNRLSDIEHVVIFMNENRSFDQYFGGYRGVRGFGDTHGPNVFAQSYPGAAGVPYGGRLLPFHFDTELPHNGECVNDVGHGWGIQHEVWNGGAMDKWVEAHLKENGERDGPNTMGYYKRSDIPFYHALADNFTICDNYFCSLLGPTDPNRLYSMTATIDPDGKAGGPHLETLVTGRPGKVGAYSWTTYPEQLEAGGISWKIYATPDGNAGDNVLPYFQQYSNPTLSAKAFAPTFPAEFQADCAAGTLPQVSWINGPLIDTEHPPAPVTFGEVVVAQVLDAITSNPALWAKTALFVTYDENGGFFDHVPPPVAPHGTPGEYLTVNPLPSEAKGIRGPIGLGPRVPTLVVSPFARGGLVCSDTFDHTSMLRFLETRFGPEVPNLTAWRRSVTGDMTSAFHFAHPDASVPSLPKPNRADPRVLGSDCPTQAPGTGSDSFPTVVGYQLPPPPQTMPGQDAGAARRPSGLCGSASQSQSHHPPFETGLVTQGNPLGLPSARTCKNRRRFAFRLHQPRTGRFVQVRVYVNGRRVKTIRARGKGTIRSVVLTGLPANFTLAVVAITNRNRRIVSKRKYRSCR